MDWQMVISRKRNTCKDNGMGNLYVNFEQNKYYKITVDFDHMYYSIENVDAPSDETVTISSITIEGGNTVLAGGEVLGLLL
jgi:hypothetical protein